MKQLVLIVASDIYLNARASCSYLWTDFAKIWHKWSLHKWEMTDIVEFSKFTPLRYLIATVLT